MHLLMASLKVLWPFAVCYVVVFALIVRTLLQMRGPKTPPPDPAFRPLNERRMNDVQWEAVETDWHAWLDRWQRDAFADKYGLNLDRWPVLSEEPRHG